MDELRHIIGFLGDKEFVVPISQVTLFIVINSCCLLLGKDKLGLLISYAFVFYWGFIFNRAYFISLLGETLIGLYVYAIMGILMLGIAIVGFLRTPH